MGRAARGTTEYTDHTEKIGADRCGAGPRFGRADPRLRRLRCGLCILWFREARLSQGGSRCPYFACLILGGGVTPAQSEGGDRYHVPRTQNPSRTPPWQPCRPRRSLCSVCLRVHPWIKAPTCASVIRGLVPRTHVSGSTGIWTASRSTAGGPVTLSLRKLPATSEAGPRFAGDHGRHGRRPALIGAGCDQGKVGGTHACGGVRLFRSTVSSMRGPAPGIPQNS